MEGTGQVQGLKCERSISDPALGNLGDEHFENVRFLYFDFGNYSVKPILSHLSQ